MYTRCLAAAVGAAAVAVAAAQPALDASLTCGVSFEGTVCLFNEEQALLPPARPPGLVGRYSFDGTAAADDSGWKHHAAGVLVPGPPWAGSGSALFSAGSGAAGAGAAGGVAGAAAAGAAASSLSISLPFPSLGGDTTFSYTFWIYRAGLSADERKSHMPQTLWCPVLATSDGAFSAAVDPVSGRVRMAAGAAGGGGGGAGGVQEFFTSNFAVSPEQWMFLAFVKHEARLRLYVDGILDSTLRMTGAAAAAGTAAGGTMLHLGPTTAAGGGAAAGGAAAGSAAAGSGASGCPVNETYFLDELKIYSRPLGRDEIQAEASGPGTVFEPSALFFACAGCTLVQAEEACPEAFHVCNQFEFDYLGVRAVARRLGLGYANLLTGDGGGEAAAGAAPGGNTGTAFCCRD